MKGVYVILGTLALIFLLGLITVPATNNTMVNLDESVTTQLGNIQVQYQRRVNLIPNLVATVKGYAAHEEKVFDEVSAAHEAMGSITVDLSTASPEEIQGFISAQDKLSGALSRLMMLQENYPDLKASEQFLTLQAQLEGTENRIATERGRYNTAVEQYNRVRRAFWTNLMVNLFFGDEFPRNKYAKFQAEEDAQKAPTVNFDN